MNRTPGLMEREVERKRRRRNRERGRLKKEEVGRERSEVEGKEGKLGNVRRASLSVRADGGEFWWCSSTHADPAMVLYKDSQKIVQRRLRPNSRDARRTPS